MFIIVFQLLGNLLHNFFLVVIEIIKQSRERQNEFKIAYERHQLSPYIITLSHYLDVYHSFSIIRKLTSSKKKN